MPCLQFVWGFVDDCLNGPLPSLQTAFAEQDAKIVRRWAWRSEIETNFDTFARKGARCLINASEKGNINTKDEDGFSALHHYVRAGASQTVKELLQARADFAANTKDGVTPLALAKTESKTRLNGSSQSICQMLEEVSNEHFLDDLSWLRAVPLFRPLQNSQLPHLAAAFKSCTFSPGQTIVHKGDEAQTFYIIHFGEALVFAEGGNGCETPVARLGSMDYFGETALLRNERRTATVKASGSEDLVALVLDREDFNALHLSEHLNFVNRRAIQPARRQGATAKMLDGSPVSPKTKSPNSLSIIVQAMKANCKLGPMISKFTAEAIELLAQQARPCTIQPGQFVFKKGDVDVDDFFIVEEGRVSVVLGGDAQVKSLGPGSSFGELALLIRAPRTASIRAETVCNLWALSRDDLQGVMEEQLATRIQEYARILLTVPNMQGFSLDQRRSVAEALVEVSYEDGSYIIKQGENGNAFYILYDGTVDVFEGTRKVATLAGRKEGRVHPFFGERALLSDFVRTASVRSVGSTTLLALESRIFLKFKELWSRDVCSTGIHKTTLYTRSQLANICKLGAGAFGDVDLVLHKPSGVKFALKALDKARVQEEELERYVLNEKVALKLADSSYLVRAAATYNLASSVEFLMEVVSGGELYNAYFREKLWGNEAAARFHVACISRGVWHLHDMMIIYRDLKPENILLDARGYCKLCDFGMAKFAVGKAFTFCGTPNYLAPEMSDPSGYSEAIDWWSLGVLTYELMVGEQPFDGNDVWEILKEAAAGIEKANWPDDTGCWGSFVKDLCKQQPLERLPMRTGSFDNVEKHQWFVSEAPGWPRFSWQQLDNGSMHAPFKPKVKSHPSTGSDKVYEDSIGRTDDWAADFEELRGPNPELFGEPGR